MISTTNNEYCTKLAESLGPMARLVCEVTLVSFTVFQIITFSLLLDYPEWLAIRIQCNDPRRVYTPNIGTRFLDCLESPLEQLRRECSIGIIDKYFEKLEETAQLKFDKKTSVILQSPSEGIIQKVIIGLRAPLLPNHFQ